MSRSRILPRSRYMRPLRRRNSAGSESIVMPRSSHASAQPTQRQLRVGEEMRHILARIFERGELRDPALHDVALTITEVRVSPDLKRATAYVMPLGGGHTDKVMAGLKRGAPYLRQ